MNTIHLLVVDDHPVVRRGIVSLLSNHADFEIVGEADTASSALKLVAERSPDIVLLDIRLPDKSGLDLLPQLGQLGTKALILTSFDDEEHILGALQHGACGFILKSVSDDVLCGAIRTVYQGGRVLSPQVTEQMMHLFTADGTRPASTFSADETRIMNLLVGGASNDEMAADLYMSVASIKRKLRYIFTKLNVENRAQAAAAIVQRHLI